MVVRHGNSVACWNIMPMSRRGPVTGLPDKTTLPEDGGKQPGHDLQQRGLAAAAGADHRGEAALAQGQVDLVEGMHVAARERLADAAQLVDRPRFERGRRERRDGGAHFVLFQASTNLLV